MKLSLRGLWTLVFLWSDSVQIEILSKLKEDLRKDVLADNLYNVYRTEEENEREQEVYISLLSVLGMLEMKFQKHECLFFMKYHNI